MIYKCPNCAAALEYNPQMNWLECNSCGSTFRMEDINEVEIEKEDVIREEHTTEDGLDSESSENMNCNLYTCSSCGAQLLINEVESATFCAYCGQPTIVFDRVSSELRPQYIIPFLIRQDQAVQGIRERMRKGFFIPKEIRNFEVERVRGIYIPYWLYDVYYYDRRVYKGEVGSGKNKTTKYFLREGECMFTRLTLDASHALNDEISQRLEPYNMASLKPFDPGYMSGFYADRYDMDTNRMNGFAILRARECFGEEIERTIKANKKEVLVSSPKSKIYKAEYAYLPAWFLTFHYMGERYTMLVNGQTGKVVGAVPFDKKKAAIVYGAIFPFMAIICSWIFYFLLTAGGKESGKLLGYIVVGTILLLTYATGMVKKVKKQMELTKARETVEFVKERQDKVS